METAMKIDQQAVKKLRDSKGWSQEHLANVSGLSLRTVQRVEAEGVASAETKLALAAALGVSTVELTPHSQPAGSPSVVHHKNAKHGYAGVALGVIGACAGILAGVSTPIELGFSFAVVGIFSGLSCIAIKNMQAKLPMV